jgi:predicted RNase H-like HicB family nuclease
MPSSLKKDPQVTARTSPICQAAWQSVAEVKKLIAEAVPLHLEGLREVGLPIPEPATECEYIEV